MTAVAFRVNRSFFYRDNANFSVVAENRLGSSTRDWRLSLDLRPEASPRDWSLDLRPEASPRNHQQHEEDEDVYEDLAVFSTPIKTREEVSSCILLHQVALVALRAPYSIRHASHNER